jgi:CRP/FNR family cyclic AMP-dependent transcriptional regulator
VTPILEAYIARCTTLTDEELALFDGVMIRQHFEAKSYLLREGEVCRFEAFVIKGCLRKYCIDDAGHDVNLQFAVEDWWISDMTSFTAQTPSKLFIQAMEDCEVLMISYADKEEIFKRVPALERMFRLMVQRSHAVLQERFVGILTQPAEERYLQFLEQYPTLPQRIPQHYIASYLGMTAEFLSKVRKRLSEKRG